jgi:hypothetical protein
VGKAAGHKWGLMPCAIATASGLNLVEVRAKSRVKGKDGQDNFDHDAESCRSAIVPYGMAGLRVNI